jgi:aspartate-semialdehyde dehydrogenase
MSASLPRVAIVGATGAVGTELIACLQQRGFPLRELRLFASERSAGRRMTYANEWLPSKRCARTLLSSSDIALFSRRRQPITPVCAAGGARRWVVIDNSSAFRMDADVPLVVPEVNADAIEGHRGIIANPNCVAIIAVVPLWPLHREFGLRRVIAATYQAASGAGAAAMEELRQATRASLAGEAFAPKVLRHPYAFNLFSHDTSRGSGSGSNEEEIKVARELRKIMQLPQLPVSVTCIRVPVLAGACHRFDGGIRAPRQR